MTAWVGERRKKGGKQMGFFLRMDWRPVKYQALNKWVLNLSTVKLLTSNKSSECSSPIRNSILGCQYDDPSLKLSQFLSLHLIHLMVPGREEDRYDPREGKNTASCKGSLSQTREVGPPPLPEQWLRKKNVSFLFAVNPWVQTWGVGGGGSSAR